MKQWNWPVKMTESAVTSYDTFITAMSLSYEICPILSFNTFWPDSIYNLTINLWKKLIPLLQWSS
jgi:hypothetical protein